MQLLLELVLFLLQLLVHIHAGVERVAGVLESLLQIQDFSFQSLLMVRSQFSTLEFDCLLDLEDGLTQIFPLGFILAGFFSQEVFVCQNVLQENRVFFLDFRNGFLVPHKCVEFSLVLGGQLGNLCISLLELLFSLLLESQISVLELLDLFFKPLLGRISRILEVGQILLNGLGQGSHLTKIELKICFHTQ